MFNIPAMFPGIGVQSSAGGGQQLSAQTASGSDFWGALLQLMSQPMGSPGAAASGDGVGTDALASMLQPLVGDQPALDNMSLARMWAGLTQSNTSIETLDTSEQGGGLTLDPGALELDLSELLANLLADLQDTGESNDDPTSADMLEKLSTMLAQIWPMADPEALATVAQGMIDGLPAETVSPENVSTGTAGPIMADAASVGLAATVRPKPTVDGDPQAADKASDAPKPGVMGDAGAGETPARTGKEFATPSDAAETESSARTEESATATSDNAADTADTARTQRVAESSGSQPGGAMTDEAAEAMSADTGRNVRPESATRSGSDASRGPAQGTDSRASRVNDAPSASDAQQAAPTRNEVAERSERYAQAVTEATEATHARAQSGQVHSETAGRGTATQEAGNPISRGERRLQTEAEQPTVGVPTSASGQDASPASGGAASGGTGGDSRRRHPEQKVLEAGLAMAGGMLAKGTTEPVTNHRKMPDTASDGDVAKVADATQATRSTNAVWADLAPVIRSEGARPAEAGEKPSSDGITVAEGVDRVANSTSVGEAAGADSKGTSVAQMISEVTGFKAPLERAVQQQLLSRLTQAVRNGETEFRLKLHPEALGRVDASLSMGREALSLVLTAETLQARQALQQGLPELRAALEQTGVQVGQCDVGLMNKQDQSGEWFSQEGHRPSFARPAAGTEAQGVDVMPAVAGAYATPSTALVDLVV